MGTLPELPEWLPEPVRTLMETSSQAGKSSIAEFDRRVRLGLATDPRMQSVWETLKEHAVTDEDLGYFFLNARLNVAYWKALKDSELLFPASERRQRDQNIREAIDNLIHLLNEYKLTIPYGLQKDMRKLHALRDRIERGGLYPEHLPTKIRGETAMRSFFMRAMKDFVLRTFDHPLHEAIATTTNVVFDTTDDTLVTSENVRKA